MVIQAYCEAAKAAIAHDERRQGDMAAYYREQAEEALKQQDYEAYAEYLADAEIPYPARLSSDGLLDRYQAESESLEESEDHLHVVDILVIKFGFKRLQYQGGVFVFDMINLISNERDRDFTSFEHKLVDRMREALNVHEDTPNRHDYYERKEKRVDEILASIGAPSREELRATRRQETPEADVSGFTAVEEELLRAFGIEAGDQSDTDSNTDA